MTLRQISRAASGKTLAVMALAAALAGCAAPASTVKTNVQLTPATAATRDLLNLPAPKGKVVVAVYGFRDQTGQYKPSPESSFSSEVTQGASAFLIKALKESGWFVPVERENLQDLLTERKIVRALEAPVDKDHPVAHIGALIPANVIIEGGIVAYDSNVRTGGAGVAYLGLSASQQYRVDQVTIHLRAVDIRGGQILNSVSTTKTIYSYQVGVGVYRFIGFKDLLQAEAGMTSNEPQQLCVKEAIESGVAHLIVDGLTSHNWTLRNEQDMQNPIIQKYVKENVDYQRGADDLTSNVAALAPADATPMHVAGN